MRTFTLLIAALFASPSFAGTIVSLDDTRTHPGATSITGWAMFGTSGPLQWEIPGLDLLDVGSVVTMTEANAADFGFDWSFAEIFLSTANPFTFNVGSYLGTDDNTLHSSSQVFHDGGTLQAMRFEVLSWEFNALRVRGSVEFASTVPEPSVFMLLSTLIPIRCRRPRV